MMNKRWREKRLKSLERRARWKRNLDGFLTFGDFPCKCTRGHHSIILQNGINICPVIYWGRKSVLALREGGSKKMKEWCEKNPLKELIKHEV